MKTALIVAVWISYFVVGYVATVVGAAISPSSDYKDFLGEGGIILLLMWPLALVAGILYYPVVGLGRLGDWSVKKLKGIA